MGNALQCKVIVVFRNDDPSACSDVDHERRCADMFEQYEVPQTLGIVPLHCADNPCDRGKQRLVRLDENMAMVEFLREHVSRSQSEIALHGCTHQVNRLSNPSRRERFEFEGLPFREQEELIARGTQVLAECFGVRPSTFIPPWNRLDHNTLRACSTQGYRIVSSGPFLPVTEGIVSLGVNCTLDSFPSFFDRAEKSDGQVLLVIMYHSRFLTTQKDIALLERALNLCTTSPHARAMTLAEVAHRYPELVWASNEAAANMVPQWQVPDTVRSRAVVYRRALGGLGIRSQIEETYHAARSLYWEGKYEEAISLSPAIDRLCKRVTIGGRVAGLCIRCCHWPSDAMPSLQTCVWPRKCLGTLGTLWIVTLLGGTAFWRLKNRDAKRETVIAILLGVAGIGCAVAYGQLAPLFY